MNMDLGFSEPDIRGELQFGNNMLYTEPSKMLYKSAPMCIWRQ
jgi:hypothetical protein